jgi:hypothetical protein
VSGPDLLHVSFIAVVVAVLLVAWIAMVLHAGEPAPTGQQEAAGHSSEAGERDDGEPTPVEGLSAREGRPGRQAQP